MLVPEHVSVEQERDLVAFTRALAGVRHDAGSADLCELAAIPAVYRTDVRIAGRVLSHRQLPVVARALGAPAPLHARIGLVLPTGFQAAAERTPVVVWATGRGIDAKQVKVGHTDGREVAQVVRHDLLELVRGQAAATIARRGVLGAGEIRLTQSALEIRPAFSESPRVARLLTHTRSGLSSW
jgi:hypothetical protein